ncbi:hypothetical protein AVEN_50114-1 [Araneus ventricosus]|uniref:Uncharacterized protein n=1 Tax=Araneus ventricosus TaxID=182803 RepID=A0A4Y2FQ84_ARAVE|nr:hypothetical protein AVEN_50114-1 [Araneus ventricosus]
MNNAPFHYLCLMKVECEKARHPLCAKLSSHVQRILILKAVCILLMEDTCYTYVYVLTFSSICDNYVAYVRIKYKSTALVIFDGYPENETVRGTKCAERAKRSRKQMSFEVMFDETMVPPVSPRKIPSQFEEQGSTYLHPDEQILLSKHDIQRSR